MIMKRRQKTGNKLLKGSIRSIGLKSERCGSGDYKVSGRTKSWVEEEQLRHPTSPHITPSPVPFNPLHSTLLC